MSSRSNVPNDSELNGRKSVRFSPDTDEAEINGSTSAIASKEDTIIRMLDQLVDGQNRLMNQLNSLETEVNKIKKNINSDISKIAHRTGQIKDLSIKTAANTLNNARKLHGAESVLEPVKQFNAGGYRDWSIRPASPQLSQSFNIPFEPVKPSQHPVINASGEHNVYSRQESRTPGYSPESPIYQEKDGYQGNKTPAYQNAYLHQKSPSPVYTPESPVYSENNSNPRNRIPAYQNVHLLQGNRTPAYSPESPGYQGAVSYPGNMTPAYQCSASPSYIVNETEDHRHFNPNRPECSSRMNRYMDSFSAGKYVARYEPYKNKHTLNRTFPKARRDESDYEPSYDPESPVFEE